MTELNTESDMIASSISQQLKLERTPSKRTMCLDSLDWFAVPVHSFNFEGRRKIYSPMGIFCSVMIYIIMLMMIADRFIMFVRGENLAITQYEREA